MAVKFLEPGGDADFAVATGNGFWAIISGTVATATDIVHGGHIKSIKPVSSGGTPNYVVTKDGTVGDSGARFSFYVYMNALPTTADAQIAGVEQAGDGLSVISVFIKTTGVLALGNPSTGSQIGSDGPTLSTGIWYRICLAYTITSTTVNRFELFKDAVSAVSVTNATLSRTGSSDFLMGRINNTGTQDFRFSDIYIDNSSALTDTGNIWVTAKRPNANGTANNFTTQIGSGGSGYGSGHSPQINERPLSTANGWSVIAVAATIEEYNIEAKSAGDIDISLATMVDYMGWISASSIISETANIVLSDGGGNTASLTSTPTLFLVARGMFSTAGYPAGTGTDIGIKTSATATTVSLYECGVVVAYIPPFAFAKSLSDSIMSGSSRTASLARGLGSLRSLSDSLMTAASRNAALAKMDSFFRSASDSVLNASSRLSSVSRSKGFTRALSDSIVSAAGRLASVNGSLLWTRIIRSITSFSNQSKHSSTFSNQSKSSSNWTNQNKS